DVGGEVDRHDPPPASWVLLLGAVLLAERVAAELLAVAVDEVLVGGALRAGVVRPLVAGRVPGRLLLARPVAGVRTGASLDLAVGVEDLEQLPVGVRRPDVDPA